MEPDNLAHLQALLNEYTRRLNKLELTKARKGYDTEPHILTEIDEIRDELKKIQTRISSDNPPLTAEEQTSILGALLQYIDKIAEFLYFVDKDDRDKFHQITNNLHSIVNSLHDITKLTGSMQLLSKYVESSTESQERLIKTNNNLREDLKILRFQFIVTITTIIIGIKFLEPSQTTYLVVIITLLTFTLPVIRRRLFTFAPFLKNKSKPTRDI